MRFFEKLVTAKRGSLAHLAGLLQRATVWTDDDDSNAALHAVAFALLKQGEVFDPEQCAADVRELLESDELASRQGGVE